MRSALTLERFTDSREIRALIGWNVHQVEKDEYAHPEAHGSNLNLTHLRRGRLLISRRVDK